MKELNKEDIIKAVRGKNDFPQYSPRISSVEVDSRRVSEGALYVALKGEKADGHDFIAEAVKKGARLVFSRDSSVKGREIIYVEDTQRALGDLAKFYLRGLDAKRFAVTGSSGKTTTKDMIYYVLNEGFRAHRSLGNHNNEIGLPLTILQMDPAAEAAIFEMGMYDLGEIDYLAEIVRPQIAVITNIGSCHIERLSTRDNIMKAKMEIAGYLQEGDLLILNGDDEYLGRLRKAKTPYAKIFCGLSEENDLIARDIETKEGRSFFYLADKKGRFSIDEKIRIELPAAGVHNIQNALCAIACGLAGEMSLDAAARGLLRFQPSDLRMQIREQNGIRLINDAYNANPESMTAVIRSMDAYGKGRKIGVLGDMLELGELSKEAHEAVGREAAKHFECLCLIGREMEYAFSALRAEGIAEERLAYFEDKERAAEYLKLLMKPGDTLLLKASRGMQLEEIAEMLFPV